LLCLARLDGLQIGQNDVEKKMREWIRSLIHKSILIFNWKKRLITTGRLLVMGNRYACRSITLLP
jgi:hypothetical protein